MSYWLGAEACVRVVRKPGGSIGLVAGAVIGGRLGILVTGTRFDLLTDGQAVDHARRHVESGERVFACDDACRLWRP